MSDGGSHLVKHSVVIRVKAGEQQVRLVLKLARHFLLPTTYVSGEGKWCNATLASRQARYVLAVMSTFKKRWFVDIHPI